jgi:hypothetical protein
LSNRLKRPGVTSIDGSCASAPSSLPVRRIGPTSPRMILAEEDPARPPASEGPRSETPTAARRPSGNPRAGETAEAGCRRSSNPQPGETAESGRRRSGCDGAEMSLRPDLRSALGARFNWRATTAADASDDPRAGEIAEAGCRRSSNPQAGCGRSFCDGLEMSLRRDSWSDLGERFKWRVTTADTSDDPGAGEMAEAGCRGIASGEAVISLRVDSCSAFGAE